MERGSLQRWRNPLLLGWFAIIDVVWGTLWLRVDGFAGNVSTYQEAARVWLAGGDPWGQVYPAPFGDQVLIAPPPSLAPFLLTAWLPDTVASWLWVGVGSAAAILAVLVLRLPLWWALFPPLVASVFWGSADTVFLLLLVAGPRWLAGALKVTFLPALVAERAWRDLAIAGALLVASLAIMPWGAFLSHLSELGAAAFAQSHGGTSATSFWPLAVVTVAALASLGWRRGWYLAVPALWPANQVGYAMVSLPVLGPLPFIAAGIAAPIAYVGPLAIIATAAWLFRSAHHGRLTAAGRADDLAG